MQLLDQLKELIVLVDLVLQLQLDALHLQRVVVQELVVLSAHGEAGRRLALLVDFDDRLSFLCQALRRQAFHGGLPAQAEILPATCFECHILVLLNLLIFLGELPALDLALNLQGAYFDVQLLDYPLHHLELSRVHLGRSVIVEHGHALRLVERLLLVFVARSACKVVVRRL